MHGEYHQSNPNIDLNAQCCSCVERVSVVGCGEELEVKVKHYDRVV